MAKAVLSLVDCGVYAWQIAGYVYSGDCGGNDSCAHICDMGLLVPAYVHTFKAGGVLLLLCMSVCLFMSMNLRHIKPD